MAAGSTYTPIQSVTTSGSQSSVTFSSIPSTYTDLILVFNGYTGGQVGCSLRFNNDSGANYSQTRLLGSGSAAASDRDVNITSIGAFVSTSTTNSIAEIIHIQNYSNTTTYKTSLLRWNNAASYVAAIVGMWRSTAAINRVDMVLSGSYFNDGSQLTLYGIASA